MDYSRQDCKDGPNTEAISDGSDPGVVVVVPEIVNVPIPEIGRCNNSGRHGVSATAVGFFRRYRDVCYQVIVTTHPRQSNK